MSPSSDGAPARISEDPPIGLQSHERAAVEKRMAAIDVALEQIHQGQHKDVAEWRRLLLEKEELQERLYGADAR